MIETVQKIDSQNPWPGLHSFSESAERFFNGRDVERAELLRLVKRETLTILYGQSGLGKSSLISAGLFPVLRGENYLPIPVRLDHSKGAVPRIRQLKNSLLAKLGEGEIEAPATTDAEGLWEYLHRKDVTFWNAKNRLVKPVFVIDQFEEIFSPGQEKNVSGETVANFAAALGSLIEHRVPDDLERRFDESPQDLARYSLDEGGYKIVLSLREDYLADLESMGKQMRARLLNRMRLEPMTGRQAMGAVMQTGGALVDEPTAEAIVKYLAASDPRGLSLDAARIEPALLSVVCTELNERRKQKQRDRITIDLLKSSEGALEDPTKKRDILETFYHRTMKNYDLRVREFVEDKLLSQNGKLRNQYPLDDAYDELGLLAPSIGELVESRLLRIEDRSGGLRVELAHDVLIDAVEKSRNERRDELRRKAEVARQAQREAELRKLEAENSKEKRRTRVVAAMGLVSLLLFAIASLAWLDGRRQKVKAENNATAARSAASDARNALLRARRDSSLREVALARADSERIHAVSIADTLTATNQNLKRAQDSVLKVKQTAIAQAEIADQYIRMGGKFQAWRIASDSTTENTLRAYSATTDKLRQSLDSIRNATRSEVKIFEDVVCNAQSASAKNSAGPDSAVLSRIRSAVVTRLTERNLLDPSSPCAPQSAGRGVTGSGH